MSFKNQKTEKQFLHYYVSKSMDNEYMKHNKWTHEKMHKPLFPLCTEKNVNSKTF